MDTFSALYSIHKIYNDGHIFTTVQYLAEPQPVMCLGGEL